MNIEATPTASSEERQEAPEVVREEARAEVEA